jgi:hypothetical protein
VLFADLRRRIASSQPPISTARRRCSRTSRRRRVARRALHQAGGEQGGKNTLDVAFDASTALALVTFQSEDHQEALAALREKRLPSSRIAERRLPP